MTSNSLQSAQFNPYFQYININNTKKNDLKKFLENPTNTESKINLNPFLPNFYLTTTGSNSNQVITNFLKYYFI